MPDEPKLDIQSDGHRSFRVIGELDGTTSGELADTIDMVEGDITLDLSQLTFIDSHGLRVILTASRARAVTLLDPSEMAMMLFNRTGVTEYLTIEWR